MQRYKEVDIAGGVGANNVFIVDKAELPTSPSSPHISRDLVLSLVFGLALGLGVSFLLERLDDTVNSIEDVERLTGLATLGVIPKVGRGRTIEKELANPWSPATEAYRSLCAALHFAMDSGLPKTLFITSSSASEGKSTTAVAVARSFAKTGLKVPAHRWRFSQCIAAFEAESPQYDRACRFSHWPLHAIRDIPEYNDAEFDFHGVRPTAS